MREFKFRAKKKDNGEWVYGNLLYKDGVVNIVSIIDIDDGCMECGCPIVDYIYNVDAETVGQYTGLKDKNGREIYKGDICKDSMGWIFEVLWDNENARFIGCQRKSRGDTYICYVGREPAVEIIGNIYENPELLESGGEDCVLRINDMCDHARYAYVLEDLIIALKGKEVLYLKYESDYQGYVDIDVLLEDGRVFSYEYSYGSCSGCDDWEYRQLTDQQILEEMKKGATYFDKLEDYQKFKEKANRS